MTDLSFPLTCAGLLATPDLDAKLVARFREPGRVRGTVERVVAEALDKPTYADGHIRQALRDARYLHSRERRLVADAINDLLRYLPMLSGLRDAPGNVPAAWQAWLDRFDGDLCERVTALTAGLSESEATQHWGHIGADLADALLASVDVDTFLAASNTRAQVVLRANRRLCTPEQLHKRLAMDGIVTRESEFAADGLIVQGRPNLRGHRAFRDGWFEVQDQASQCLTDHVTGTGPIIDWCAGAGGKALALASRFPKRPVIALDVRQRALHELGKRAKRAGVRIKQGIHGQSATPLLKKLGAVQTVVVDAPCTGTGVWRRHPAYRLGVDATRIRELMATQQRVLHAAAQSVATGGQLVYATCSVLRGENEEAVSTFLSGHPEFELNADKRWPVGPTDGFYTADLRRTV